MSSAGCGGDGGSSSGGGGAGGAGGGGGTTTSVDPETECFDYSAFDGATPAVSFKTDVLPVLQRSCGVSTSCHGNPTPPNAKQPYLGPNQSTTATTDDITKIFDGIVNKPAVQEPQMSIVATGDPEHSFLLYKVDGQVRCSKLSCAATDKCGDIMPPGPKVTLTSAELDAIRRWIAQGAQNN